MNWCVKIGILYQGVAHMKSTYNDIVYDHFTNPRNMGKIEDPCAFAEIKNPIFGDILQLFLRIVNGIIIDAKFKAFGSKTAIAAGSMTTELIKGKSISDALLVSDRVIYDKLGGLPAGDQHCTLLAEKVVHTAIEDYLKTSRTSCSVFHQLP
jgi:nitrogen fixation protein NifU and related proteins